MLTELRINNCLIFNEKVSFSMMADMRCRRFGTNVHTGNGFHVLKSAAIYGPNNSGKTCLIRVMGYIRNVILNSPGTMMSNLFRENDDISEIGVSFTEDGRLWSYDIAVDTKNAAFTYERFSEVTTDKAGRIRHDVWFERDTVSETYRAKDENIAKLIPFLGTGNILIYLTNTKQFALLEKAKDLLSSFARKIEIVDIRAVSREQYTKKTVSILKQHSAMTTELVDLIKNADMYLDDIRYEENGALGDDERPEEMKIVSDYRGVSLPSMIYDSEGTKKMEFLAGYIIEAMHEEKILLIDELDSSLHFKLTRAIVALFDSEINDCSQLIFTTHDVSLLDCRKLFRKEQIWFMNKDEKQVYLYPLSVFTSNDNGLRGDTSDIAEKYRKGMLGALPDPQLVKTLLLIKSHRGKIQ